MIAAEVNLVSQSESQQDSDLEEPPTTEAPTEPPTEPPVTEAPTEAPTEPPTELPATEPVTETPATELPATEMPATEAPATEAVVTEPETEAVKSAVAEGVAGVLDKSPDEAALKKAKKKAEKEEAEKRKKESEKQEEEAKRLYEEKIGESMIDFTAYPAGNITENTNKIYDFLRNEMGLNHAAACGVLANIQCESNFVTTAVGDGGTSYGLCQWHLDRFSRLVAWCNANGYNYHLVDGQVGYMQYELTNGYAGVYDYIRNVPDTAQGAYDAAYYWCYYYEVPSNTEANSKLRGNLAMNEYYPRQLGMAEEQEAEPQEEAVIEAESEAGTHLIRSESAKLWEEAPDTLLRKAKLGVAKEKLFSLD